MRNNCYCGLIAVANCTRCTAAACEEHLKVVNLGVYRLRPPRSGRCFIGATLGEAAFKEGYSQVGRERLVCKDCRKVDGKRQQRNTLVKSRSWGNGSPFSFAITAAYRGYVVTELPVTYAEVIQGWLRLNLHPYETITISRMVRPAKTRCTSMRREVARPAEYVQDEYEGWLFPRTIQVLRPGMYDNEEWHWEGSTVILTDGRVLQNNEFTEQPPGGTTYRLVVEMARKICAARNIGWHGPSKNWGS